MGMIKQIANLRSISHWPLLVYEKFFVGLVMQRRELPFEISER
jgi:hypothetical protein